MANKYIRPPKELRGRWYLQVEKYNKTVSEVCGIFGISRKTYYKWYKIDHPIGRTGKGPRKMHPHTKIQGNTRLFIVKNKLLYNYGPKKMCLLVERRFAIYVSPQAIYRFYKKRRLIKKPQKQLKWYCPLKKPYIAELPGENVQLDVKYVPGKEQTWVYQYRFMDVITNLQYAVNMDFKDASSTIEAFKLAKRNLPFTIYGIQTDNGSEFRGKFHEYLVRNKIPHRYIPKRSAPWNGKVERANRSIDDEYYLNTKRPWKSIKEYVKWYNYERPHLGKKMYGLTPYQKYLSFSKSVTP